MSSTHELIGATVSSARRVLDEWWSNFCLSLQMKTKCCCAKCRKIQRGLDVVKHVLQYKNLCGQKRFGIRHFSSQLYKYVNLLMIVRMDGLSYVRRRCSYGKLAGDVACYLMSEFIASTHKPWASSSTRLVLSCVCVRESSHDAFRYDVTSSHSSECVLPVACFLQNQKKKPFAPLCHELGDYPPSSSICQVLALKPHMVLLFQLGPGPQIMISKAEGENESWTNTQK